MAQTTSTLSGVTINEIHTIPFGISQDLNGDNFGDLNDEFIELYNTSGTAVDLEGWELWESQSSKYTFQAGDSISAGGYFTIVDSFGGTSNPIQNVSGPSTYSDFFFGFSSTDSYILYDNDTKDFIVIAGPDISATDLNNHINFFKGVRPGANQVGVTETMGSEVTGDSSSRLTDGDDTWVSDTPTPGDPNCFLKGTLIATLDGEVRVEDLQIGDRVLTADGRSEPVLWVARQSVSKRRYAERARPVRIASGALGASVPHRDLIVTGDHGMVMDGMVVNASALVNGSSVKWVPLAELPEEYTVYHVETELHDTILANGAASETFVDYAGRKGFDNFEAYRDRYGDERIITEMPLARIHSARLVPPALKARLDRIGSRLVRA